MNPSVDYQSPAYERLLKTQKSRSSIGLTFMQTSVLDLPGIGPEIAKKIATKFFNEENRKRFIINGELIKEPKKNEPDYEIKMTRFKHFNKALLSALIAVFFHTTSSDPNAFDENGEVRRNYSSDFVSNEVLDPKVLMEHAMKQGKYDPRIHGPNTPEYHMARVPDMDLLLAVLKPFIQALREVGIQREDWATETAVIIWRNYIQPLFLEKK